MKRDTILTSLDGRTKFISWLVLTLAMFSFDTYQEYFFLFLLIILLMLFFFDSAERRSIYKSWKLFLFIPCINLVANMLFVNGEILYSFFIFLLTDTDIKILMRIFMLLLLSKLTLVKTDEKDLGIAIGKIVHSISLKRVKSTAIPLIIIIMLSFIDKFRVTVKDVNKAYLLRTNGIMDENFVKRIRSRALLLSPILLISLKKSEQVSTALLAKGYHKGTQIVNYEEIRYEKKDFISYSILLCLLVLFFILREGFLLI